jgi:succinate dehydrogenase / fumarate reductase cytochrome b subunit
MSQTQRRIDLPILHLPQLIGLAMGLDPRDLGLQRHIIPTTNVLNLTR